MKWECVRYGVERCHDRSGEILGTATEGGGEYYATFDGKPIGSYINMESAKAAVESAYKNRIPMP